MTKIILIRHCRTEGNSSGKMQGYHNDSSFTDEGLAQMKKLAYILKNENIKAVYCSDLGRAIETAKAIAKKHMLEITPLRELREADIGEWGNLPVKESIEKWIEYYEKEKAKGVPRETIRPPGGENTWDHQRRLIGVIKKIIKDNLQNTIVIVGHSGTNRVILGSLENKDPDDFYKVDQDNACLNIIETDGEKSEVKTLNDISHLKDEKN